VYENLLKTGVVDSAKVMMMIMMVVMVVMVMMMMMTR
jgi:hypothetical protein